MSARRRVTILLTAVGVALAWVGHAVPTDEFLDRPLPTGLPTQRVSHPSADGNGSSEESEMLPTTSFWNGVQLLGTLSGKTVRLPQELKEWPDERTERSGSWTFGLPPDGKVRPLFEALCVHLHLTWRYDRAADAIDLEPEWKRADPRSGKELIRVLTGTRPGWTYDPTPDGRSSPQDPWRLAFDALLSRPENFAFAGALRLCHDNHAIYRPGLVENLCAAPLADAIDARRVLVLNKYVALTNKDVAGELAFYLFDEDGRFVGGGVDAIVPRRTGTMLAARVDAGRTVTVDWGLMDIVAVRLHFALVNDDLILQGSTDRAGAKHDAEETQDLDVLLGSLAVRRDYRFPPR